MRETLFLEGEILFTLEHGTTGMNKPRQRISVVEQSNFEATRRHIRTAKFSVLIGSK